MKLPAASGRGIKNHNKQIGSRGILPGTLPFLSCSHYIIPMLDSCLEPGKIEVLKMLDLQTKSAMKLVRGQVSVQATHLASRITDMKHLYQHPDNI